MWVLTDNGDGTESWTWIENDNVVSQKDLGNSGVVDSDGWTTDELNNPYKIDSKGNVEFKDKAGTVFKYDKTKGAFVDSSGNAAGGELATGFLNKINSALGTKLTSSDLFKLGVGGAGALLGISNLNAPSVTKVGYQGEIPKYTASRNMLTAPPEGRRPGSGGIDFGGGATYKDKNGNVVSSNERSLADLKDAAANNPFNEKQTNYGIAPIPTPRAADKQTFVAPKPLVKAEVGTSNTAERMAAVAAAAELENRRIAAEAAAKRDAEAAARAAAAKADADKRAADAKAAADKISADFAKTPEGMAQRLGKTLPTGWSKFSPDQKIDWFNKNNLDPSKLLSVGVTQNEINWMKDHGYNGDTITKAAAAGLSLPNGWNNYTAQEKIDYFNKNNVGINALTKAGTSADDLSWMNQHGYNGSTINQGIAAGVSLPTGWNNLDAKGKIDWLNKNNVSADKLVAAGTSQSDIDWMKNNGYTGNAIGVSLPTGFESFAPQQKIDYFNQNNVGVDKLLQAGTSQSDINWMKQNGYTGNAAGLSLPNGWETYAPQQKIDYFNQNNVGADKLLQAGTSQADIDWMNQHGYTGAPVQTDMAMPAEKVETTGEAAAPVQTAPQAPAPLNLPSDWGNFGATDKINYFNQNNISAAQLADQGVAQSDIDWMKQNGYKGMAAGGLANLARGGSTGRYLQGETDGMADKIPTTIDGGRPAALSHGEFVVPADVVSHLGNGNSDAGAKKLYSMMDKIRMARTGSKKQGKRINPDKFMPGGLAAAYASGGKVLGFDGTTGSTVPAGTTGVEQTLASWTGDYIPNMLGQTAALANSPYQAYTGPLTAGASGLQNAAFTGAGNLTTPSSIGTAAINANALGDAASQTSYTPTSFTNQFYAPTPYQNTNFTSGVFDSSQAQQYMNPYLQQALDPQIEEARRQSQITQAQNDAKMTQAGAFGGGRQAILNAETQRNLGTNLANITGQGYNTAYTNAMSQYNQDQARDMQRQQATEQSKQFGAGQGMTSAQNAAQYGLAAGNATEASNQFASNLGLQGLQTGLQGYQAAGSLGALQNTTDINNINAQAGLGAVERGIQSEGIAADQTAFNAARDNPYKMLQFQQSMLNGLPITATNYTGAQPSAVTSGAAGIKALNDALKALGVPGY
jgi:hypothetical protein